MKIKHILITTDLSDEALRPFKPILELAKQLHARVTLLHVVFDLKIAPHGAPLAPAVSSPEIGQEVEQAKQLLQAQCAEFGAGLKLEPAVIASSDIAKGVSAYADHNRVDLIALSTHGRTGWKQLVLGSVAEAILQHAGVPVLSFPRAD